MWNPWFLYIKVQLFVQSDSCPSLIYRGSVTVSFVYWPLYSPSVSVSGGTLICKTASQDLTSSQQVTLKIDGVSVQASESFTYNEDPLILNIEPKSSFFRWVSRSVGFAPALQLCRHFMIYCNVFQNKQKRNKGRWWIYLTKWKVCWISPGEIPLQEFFFF